MAVSSIPVLYGMLAWFQELSSVCRNLCLQNLCSCVALVAGIVGGHRPVQSIVGGHRPVHRHTGPEAAYTFLRGPDFVLVKGYS